MTAADVEKQKLIAKIINLQKRIGRCTSNDAPNAWLELNLTIAQLKTLFFIEFEGVTNFKKVAQALDVTPPNVTGIIDHLVKQGLVKRAENPQNRRMLNLSLTKAGNVLVEELKQRKTAHLSGILEDLSCDELSILLQGLSILTCAAEKKILTIHEVKVNGIK
jgi:DNA-binding MarR family transcriptional regulator